MTATDLSGNARREAALTEEVVQSFAGTADARARDLLQGLVRHLHAFVREQRVTEREWETAIGFLTRAGHITDDRRQEYVLLSDVLGISMLTIAVNAPRDPRATEPTVFGPFFVNDAPEVPYGGDIAAGASGVPCWAEGVVTDLEGRPLANAALEVWEADEDGFYDVQYDDGRVAGRAITRTRADGSYGFWSVRPAPYPIPGDGPVGDLLRVAGRSPMRPAHLHFKVSAESYETLVTHCFIAEDPHLHDDAVFGVKESLIVSLSSHPASEAPGGRALDRPWWRMRFDIRLQPRPRALASTEAEHAA